MISSRQWTSTASRASALTRSNTGIALTPGHALGTSDLRYWGAYNVNPLVRLDPCACGVDVPLGMVCAVGGVVL